MKLRLLIFFLIISQPIAWAQQKPVVAVLNFHNGTKKFYLDDLQKSFPSLLKTELSQKGSLVVVEREKVEYILKEQNFILSDLSEDTAKQAKVGNLLGADYVITGDISEANGQLRIDVAITKIANGRVIGEKVTGPSKDHSNTMARVLAQNIAFQLTGEGERVQKIRLQGAPTVPFFISTTALGITSGILFSQKKKLTDNYQHAGSLGPISSDYKKANTTYKAATAFTCAAAVSLGAYIYCLIKNNSSPLDIFAEHATHEPPRLAVNPVWDIPGKNLAINLSVQF
jgi:TolB-like protein